MNVLFSDHQKTIIVNNLQSYQKIFVDKVLNDICCFEILDFNHKSGLIASPEKYAEKLGFEYLFTHSQLPFDKLNQALLSTDDDDFILIKVNTHAAVKDFIVYLFCEMQNLHPDIIGYLDTEKIAYEFNIDHEIIYIGDNSYYVKINNYKKSASSLDWWKWKKWDYLINKCLKNINGTIIE